MHRLTFLIVWTLCGLPCVAQQFITKGKITYERKVNIGAYYNSEYGSTSQQKLDQVNSDFFTLQFDNNRSIYEPLGNIRNLIFSRTAVDNIVYKDFEKDWVVSLKNVFEKKFFISDSLPKIVWKIRDDFREIAGFNCRRATTMLFDSVFVVAFYTDEIILPDGPENFSGLPGMILGLVINRLHTSWYATKVELNVDERKIVTPQGGNPINNKDYDQQLISSLKTWEGFRDRIIWACKI